MKKIIPLLIAIISLTAFNSMAQTRAVVGTVIDTTKQTVIGAVVTLTSDQKDSTNTTTDVNGKFSFSNIKGTRINITIKSIGYTGVLKHFTLDVANPTANVGTIVMHSSSTALNEVKIVGQTVPIVVKEDTVEYKISSLNLRANATLEDALKKAPGVDVDPSTGAITAQGQSVTKVRINGKDYMGGDVTSLTKNIPADLLENAQIIDDYGDQANLTGIKTGDPTKILNVTIRKDRNYGTSLQATAGDGSDLLPSPQKNGNRFLGSLNLFNFKGDRQITVLGNLNNTNLSLFSFGTVGGGGGNFGGGGGGGRGNAARTGGGGAGGFGGGSPVTQTNGINTTRSIGVNFRDQWGKKVSVYGSYSFQDNDVFTTSISQQKNTSQFPTNTNQNSVERDNNINHRFNFNVEWRPDTSNYFKFTPNFTYGRTKTNSVDSLVSQQTSRTTGNLYTASQYSSVTNATSTAPSGGITSLYFHKFNGKGRNMFINFAFNASKSDSYQNPIYTYAVGIPLAPLNQQVTNNSTTRTFSTSLSYNEPLSKVSFLEFNYAYNHSYTSSDRETDTLSTGGTYNFYQRLSNNYNYTFTTNRIGLNYRVVEKKYNLVVGAGIQPNTLDGHSVTTNTYTHVTTLNFSPQARFVYNFARSNSLSFNYNGTSNQPSFNQLQPVIDYSNALYPVQGNPNLKPSFDNNFSLRYNKFSLQTGNVLFANLTFDAISNNVATNVITIPKSAAIAASPTYRTLQNTNLTTYQNADGYYSARGFFAYSKPWSNRKYTLFGNINGSFTNNVGYVGNVDSATAVLTTQKNIAKNWNVTPGLRFRVDLTDILDIQAVGSYGINKTSNTVNSALLNAASNVRTLTLGVNGKNYFWKDWTLSYDFQHLTYYGYTIPVKNPNLLTAYAERRFLKNNAATIRLTVVDIFNQNTGFSTTTTATAITQTNTNRLGRYALLTFTYRLQKFSGRSTMPTNDGNRFRRDGNGDRGGDRGGQGGPPGGGFGGPPPGGPGIE
ncbi:TonB-dependent receptor [Mucilaginibacter ginkgonis]|uniref:TonB-dependent receptor n=1 Tax=Mucilaginibacter ginkgonis TaxID=2682091 RepID=A0A6I4I084_9SPHI|nr:TonB-dependent receptor [Mucilaginibacter ginkgonis]QQL49760.1 TonB-dependent receptor [Mucilaginibacter ginkgonis]